MLKKCSKCKAVKPLSEFYCETSAKDGHSYECKECRAKYQVLRRRTKDGVIKHIYGNQRGNSIRRNHPMPSYTLNELKDWAFKQDIFHSLYNAWVDSDYKRMLIPSFDRVDDYQGYTLDSITIMTWRDNSEKANKDTVDGILDKALRPVIQSNIDGTVVQAHYSGRQAGRVTGVSYQNIYKCCRGIRPVAGGFRWRYA